MNTDRVSWPRRCSWIPDQVRDGDDCGASRRDTAEPRLLPLPIAFGVRGRLRRRLFLAETSDLVKVVVRPVSARAMSIVMALGERKIMRVLILVTALLLVVVASPANAVTRYVVGQGTSLGGFCQWTAYIDTYPDGSYRLYYETDCGANGLAVPKDRFGKPKTLAQMKAETLSTPGAIAAGRQAPRIARRFAAEKKLKANPRIGQ